MISEFRAFLLKTNALALAIGVIIGLALGTVVNSLVSDIIMPPIGLALGGVDFDQLKTVLRASADPAQEVAIRWGAFINTLITFVVVALVVFLLSRRLLAPDPVTKTCPYCHETVPERATRCKFCTSQLEPRV